MLARSPLELRFSDVFVVLSDFLPHTAVNLKIEGFNLGGSIKMKPALSMIESLEQQGLLGPGRRVIESSSGNLGLALAVVCAVKGHPFTCVSDPNMSPQTERLIRSYGADVVIVRQRDPNGGFLASRIALIRSMVSSNPDLVWVNQYANLENPGAHLRSTGPEILAQFPAPDLVFVGAGTTGTLGGVSWYLRKHSPRTRIIAVDSAGSVTFGGPPGKRHIPGLGTSRKPEIALLADFDAVELVPEPDTVLMCRKLARRGLLLGGSTGTVLSAVLRWRDRIPDGACVVAISPDLGDHYTDTIYDDAWVAERYPGLLARLVDSEPSRAIFDRSFAAPEKCHAG
ncbi:2,3-diaminopropionate biosynthesis protein SbnA [Polyangium fumosum]|uniref:2,3-diaminopropionate biosynthesis protein SbnA n=1 Tax=Polyangium fumosum TaxID=889272 RepID=A0A4V5PN47_9BACT|nr:2,3-diaminopropionate biosynthesis protein SbnA [Polyangium fumosum]TKD09431.1 2,3-diaminopropionate biosynthesis protein SbnA [Polyangium fumosum]